MVSVLLMLIASLSVCFLNVDFLATFGTLTLSPFTCGATPEVIEVSSEPSA
jgi:hypothetical protein